MKTTLELPDDLFRSLKSRASSQGRSLKDYFTEALREKLTSDDSRAGGDPPWKRLAGAVKPTKKNREELHRIQQRITEEFEKVDELE